jgi:hypothetical protein
MGSDMDPAKTYVLEETSITKSKTIEELAEMAAGTAAPTRSDEELDYASLDRSSDSA